ncbi:uncharacterized protein LOC127241505 [Andrographis paniculata]|uniref:uncharacterized protein LOC127241505 n=1 Tax=Andrographis paniculata TaxID=175694 RepID=UPI0021E8EA9A|nr:uncharacterized protein LOC127241505 [Andrographis paniculata]
MQKNKRIDNDTGEVDLLAAGSSSSSSSSSPPRSLPISSAGVNYILHPVSKFDTLAGVAIKYGVEVADIKRLNGLLTDHQMFALKTIQIPLPGRHPPSPNLSNGHDAPQRPSSSEQTPPNRRHSDIISSLQSLKLKSSDRKVTPAMSTLQSYYGLKPPNQKTPAEGFEMAVYRNGIAQSPDPDDPFSTRVSLPNPPLSHQRKSKSVSNGLMSANGTLHVPLLLQESKESSSAEKLLDRLVRRRQKSEADFASTTPPEKLLKEENNTGSSAVSAITGKRLALRPKSANRSGGGGDPDPVGINAPIVSTGMGDSFLTDNFEGVRKSSSASSLQESDNGALSSIWPTAKWSLKPDFQALSSAAMPMFDGLPKPMGRRNKAALD